MTTEIAKTDQNQVAIVETDVSTGGLYEAMTGDIGKLSIADRTKFIAKTCEVMGLNPLTKPFDIISLQGKTKLYANAGCAEQLRKIHKVNLSIVERKEENGIYIVRIKARDAEGREDESIAALPLPPGGEARANAIMKCETKAKRRVTFSICGLTLLAERDEDYEQRERPAKVSSVSTVETTSDIAGELNAAIEAAPDTAKASVHEVKVKAERITAATPPPVIHEAEIVPEPAKTQAEAAFDEPEPPSVAPVDERERLAMELQTAIGEKSKMILCVQYMVANKWIEPNAPVETAPIEKLTKAVTQSQAFMRAVEQWDKKRKEAK